MPTYIDGIDCLWFDWLSVECLSIQLIRFRRFCNHTFSEECTKNYLNRNMSLRLQKIDETQSFHRLNDLLAIKLKGSETVQSIFYCWRNDFSHYIGNKLRPSYSIIWLIIFLPMAIIVIIYIFTKTFGITDFVYSLRNRGTTHKIKSTIPEINICKIILPEQVPNWWQIVVGKLLLN